MKVKLLRSLALTKEERHALVHSEDPAATPPFTEGSICDAAEVKKPGGESQYRVGGRLLSRSMVEVITEPESIAKQSPAPATQPQQNQGGRRDK